jgi:hypothetical protein
MNDILRNWKLWLMLSLTLGLAPFLPEPHMIGKIRWIAGGCVGMQAIDWFDALLHGGPWIMFLVSIGINLKQRFSAQA